VRDVTKYHIEAMSLNLVQQQQPPTVSQTASSRSFGISPNSSGAASKLPQKLLKIPVKSGVHPAEHQ
jgi:hypothetical protein